jgi:hypothetical protein
VSAPPVTRSTASPYGFCHGFQLKGSLINALSLSDNAWSFSPFCSRSAARSSSVMRLLSLSAPFSMFSSSCLNAWNKLWAV